MCAKIEKLFNKTLYIFYQPYYTSFLFMTIKINTHTPLMNKYINTLLKEHGVLDVCQSTVVGSNKMKSEQQIQ